MVTGSARVEPLDDGGNVTEDTGIHQGCGAIANEKKMDDNVNIFSNSYKNSVRFCIQVSFKK